MGGGATKEAYVLRVDGSASRRSMQQSSKSVNISENLDKSSLPDVSPPKIAKSASLLKHQSSRKIPSINQHRGSSVSRLNSTCNSDKFPWIIKNANFNSMTLDNFEVGRIIGRGMMGTVRIAKVKHSQGYFVLKAIQKDYVIRHRDERHVVSEREVLQAVNSCFCIRLFGTFQDSHTIYFAMEIAIGGELFRRLSKKESFGPETAKFYASEIFCALEHLQSLGYVYRDLKPENVMLDEDGHCKLVDFGFSTRKADDEMIHTVCGTPAYLSPEQLEGKFTNGYTRIVDWWSFGIFLYELRTGKTPFCKSDKESNYEIYLRIMKKKINFPRQMDEASKDLISQLCLPDLSKRLKAAEQIKTHPYFTIDWEYVNRRQLVPPFVPRIKEIGDDHYFNLHHDPGFQFSPGGDSRLFIDGF